MKSTHVLSHKLLTVAVVLGLLTVAASAAAELPESEVLDDDADVSAEAGHGGVERPNFQQTVGVNNPHCDSEAEDCFIEFAANVDAHASKDRPTTSYVHASGSVKIDDQGHCVAGRVDGQDSPVMGLHSPPGSPGDDLGFGGDLVPFYEGEC